MKIVFFSYSRCRYGPHFEDISSAGNVTNITVQVGSAVYLNCRISLLQDKTVRIITSGFKWSKWKWFECSVCKLIVSVFKNEYVIH